MITESRLPAHSRGGMYLIDVVVARVVQVVADTRSQ
jgi:hypothetical protein